MALSDQEWPGYTQWYSCPGCRRLWTFQGREMVVLDRRFALAPSTSTPGVPGHLCLACKGAPSSDVTSL